ncbi:molybdenum cofactor guanylyltransferase [Bacillus sp. FJAT-27225]|uniref:molybdenum cofactor guanylyltransferase n=1 Tax=Bacillus sp. FJAT-27225 TaxID=1743144 RepID=UPI00080C2DCF|nr:molybdenum cofactor guanylyltransferase [Bacillus sp. FJAT-27225]OCA82334.1 molybdenum cofactor guanylyltransferase [Bacillus sp. FJAT-27225]
MKATAILLSGGKSSRMGTNKALLDIGGKPNIERIRDELAGIFDEIILVTNDPGQYEFLNVRTVADDFPGKGPLAGIHAGLKASSYDTGFVVACDMPFVSGDLAESLIRRLGNHDAIVPMIGGTHHPLFAVYKKSIIKEIQSCIEEGRLRIKDLLRNIDAVYIDKKELQTYSAISLEKVFFNMNHPEEYEYARKAVKDKNRL